MTLISEKDLAAILPQAPKADWPGCAIAILKDGKVAQSHFTGLANVEHRAPIGHETVFRIASITKQFLCAGLIALSDDGKLDLDAPLSDFVDLHANLKSVTIRQAMNNTSGLRDHLELWYMAGGGLQVPHRRAASLGLCAKQTKGNFAPGSRFLYSNANFLLLSQVAETASGQSLEAYLNSRFFEPLGMTRTQLLGNHFDVVDGLATGYVIDHSGALKKGRMTTELWGEGAAVSSLGDLAKWVGYYRDDPDGIIQRMAIPTQFAQGVSPYGLGLFAENWAGLSTICHTGLWPGYLTELVWFPSENTALITIANVNSHEPTLINRAIAEKLFPDHAARQAKPTLDEKAWTAAKSAGLWVCKTTPDVAEFSDHENGFKMFGSHGFGARLRIEGPTRLAPDFARSDYTGIVIERATLGEIELTLANGNTLTLVPASQSPASHPPEEFAGDWWCADIEALLRLTYSDGTFSAETPGFRGHDWSAEMLAGGVLMIKDITGPWPRRFYLSLTEQDGQQTLVANGPRVRRFEYVRLSNGN